MINRLVFVKKQMTELNNFRKASLVSHYAFAGTSPGESGPSEQLFAIDPYYQMPKVRYSAY